MKFLLSFCVLSGKLEFESLDFKLVVLIYLVNLTKQEFLFYLGLVLDLYKFYIQFLNVDLGSIKRLLKIIRSVFEASELRVCLLHFFKLHF